MAALDGLGFADYFIGMGEKGRAAGIEQQRRSAFQQFAPQVMQGNAQQRREMVPQIAQQSPEAFADLMPVIQKMDQAELEREKTAADQWASVFTGAADDNDFAQRVQFARANGAPENTIPRSRGEAEFMARKVMGLKATIENETKRRELDLRQSEQNLRAQGNWGAPFMVQAPDGSFAYAQANPQAGTARPVPLPGGFKPVPPAAAQPSFGAPVQVDTTGGPGLVQVDPRTGQARLVQLPPGVAPKQAAPKPQAFTEMQSKANNFASRAVEAEEALQKTSDALTSYAQRATEYVPFVGNSLASNDFQLASQAKRNMINAILRRESGAVIADSEFENADRQYFPRPGDSKEVLAQKAQNRATVIRALIQEAGPAYTGKPFAQGAQRPPAAPQPRPQPAPQRQMQTPPRAPAPAAPRAPVTPSANDPLGIR